MVVLHKLKKGALKLTECWLILHFKSFVTLYIRLHFLVELLPIIVLTFLLKALQLRVEFEIGHLYSLLETIMLALPVFKCLNIDGALGMDRSLKLIVVLQAHNAVFKVHAIFICQESVWACRLFLGNEFSFSVLVSKVWRWLFFIKLKHGMISWLKLNMYVLILVGLIIVLWTAHFRVMRVLQQLAKFVIDIVSILRLFGLTNLVLHLLKRVFILLELLFEMAFKSWIVLKPILSFEILERALVLDRVA